MDPKTYLATIARLVLASIAGTLVKDGYLQSSGTEAFIGAGMLIATGLWGVWNGYGKDIAKASLDILRAKVLAAAARANANPAAAAPALAAVAAHVEDTAPKPAPAAPPVASVAILAIGMAALWAGQAHAGRLDDVPGFAVENWLSDVVFPLMFEGFLIGCALGLIAGALMVWGTRKLIPAAVLVAAVSVLAWAAPADAQNRGLTGNPIKDIGNAIASKPDASAKALSGVEAFLAKPFQDLADFIGSDSDEAIALSTVVPELQDGHGQQCWMATKQFGQVVKAHPVPLTLKAMTDLEALRLLTMAANNLCANVHCTQVFNDLANGVRTLSPINAIPVPSLDSLCSKVPQVAVVPPVPVPPTTPAPASVPAQP